jgi:hypothetical protein
LISRLFLPHSPQQRFPTTPVDYSSTADEYQRNIIVHCVSEPIVGRDERWVVALAIDTDLLYLLRGFQRCK